MKHKYPVSALCRVLGISRSAYYYRPKPLTDEAIELEIKVRSIFRASHNVYGARRIKSKLEAENIVASRRRIRAIMKKLHLVSVYTKAKYRHHPTRKNEERVRNVLNREFSHRKPLEVIVSDLTYVRINQRWAYVCAITDLFNREVIGYSCGLRRDAALIQEAFSTISYPLDAVQYFHTDRGKEFDNNTICAILKANGIKRSLSRPGNPYDNAVAENIFKSFKTEFLERETFQSLNELREKLSDYVQWWNNDRVHTSLENMTPLAYRTKKAVEDKDRLQLTP